MAEEPGGASVAATTAGAASGEARAELTLVGKQSMQGLTERLTELLERAGIACDAHVAGRFEPAALFAESNDDRGVTVYVVLGGAGEARLYFRGPRGKRFLLRRLQLPDGLDDVGEELIGQVVEASVTTLLRSSVGLTREQASAEVLRTTEDDSVATKPSAQPPRVRPAPPPALATPEPDGGSPALRTLGFSVSAAAGAGYAMSVQGGALGVAHGPHAELSVGLARRISLGLRALVERPFARVLHAGGVRARVESLLVRGGLELGVPLSQRGTLAGSLTAGVDRTEVTPEHARADGVVPASASDGVAFVVRAELGYRLRFGHFELAPSAFGDVALDATRFELRADSGLVTVASPWRVRPGVALVLGGRL